MSGGTKKEKKVRAVPNPYLATAAGGDDLPFDNQLMMRRRVNDELVRDWRERVVFSRFAGFIAGADREALCQDVEDWHRQEDAIIEFNRVRGTPQQQDLSVLQMAAVQQEAIRRRLETRLRGVFDVWPRTGVTEDRLTC